MKRVDRQEAIDEARMLAQLNHPHVCKHFDSFVGESRPACTHHSRHSPALVRGLRVLRHQGVLGWCDLAVWATTRAGCLLRKDLPSLLQPHMGMALISALSR